MYFQVGIALPNVEAKAESAPLIIEVPKAKIIAVLLGDSIFL